MNQIVLNLPKNFSFSPQHLRWIIENNPFQIEISDQKMIFEPVFPSENIFCKEGWQAVAFPKDFQFSAAQANDFFVQNTLKTEFFDHTLFIKFMAHNHNISCFNDTFHGEMYVWNRTHKLGRLYDCDCGFKLSSGSWLEFDGSWIAFSKASGAEQVAWKSGKMEVVPTFFWEIISNPNDLEKDLKKIIRICLKEFGFEEAIVADPFEKLYHHFKKGSETATIYRFDVPFRSTNLPELVLNFEEIYELAGLD